MLKKMGGLGFIIEQYVECRSVEACDNLFLVVRTQTKERRRKTFLTRPAFLLQKIYDYVIANLVAEKKLEASSEQIQVLLEMLRRFEAPQFFATVFKFVRETRKRKGGRKRDEHEDGSKLLLSLFPLQVPEKLVAP
jgi:hypothetical protein